MNIGDLVCWHDKPALVGVVYLVATRIGEVFGDQHVACSVQWANGVTSNHSTKWLVKLETS